MTAPNPSTTSSSKRKAAIGFALAAIVAIELLIALNPRWVRSTGTLSWRSKIHWLLHEEPPRCTRLFMGDSRVLGGLDPLAFDEAMSDGECSLNAGLSDARAADQYFLLKRLIEADRAPKTLITDLSASALHEEDKDLAEARLFVELVEWSDLPETWGLHPVRLLGRKAASELLPSYHHRSGLREVLRSPLLPNASHWFAQPRMPPQSIKGKGRQAQLDYFEAALRYQRGMSVYCEGPPEYYPPRQWPARFSPDPVQVHYAEALIQLASEHGIQLYILNWPVSCRLSGNGSPFEMAHKMELNRIGSAHPEVVWLNPDMKCRPNRKFCADRVHFAPEGVQEWSAEAARLFKEKAASTTLP